MDDEIKKIEAVCTKSELAELKILQHAMFKTVNAYKDDPSASNKKNWDAARSGLAESVDRLYSKYFPNEHCFPHRKGAHEWLVDQGYKCSVGKFHNDCKRGLCVIEGDGTVRESALVAYAAKNLKRLQDEDGNLTPLTEEKTRLEIERLRKQNERSDFELEKEHKKYIARRDFSLEISARAGQLDQGVQNFFRVRTADWVSAVGGDVKKVAMVLDMIMAEWNELLDEYAKLDRFKTAFEEEG